MDGTDWKQFNDRAYRGLLWVQEDILATYGERDGAGSVISAPLYYRADLADAAWVMHVEVDLLHPEGLPEQVSWMAFKACSYALYTICREQMKPTLLRIDTRMTLPYGTAVDAHVEIGEVVMRLSIQIEARKEHP